MPRPYKPQLRELPDALPKAASSQAKRKKVSQGRRFHKFYKGVGAIANSGDVQKINRALLLLEKRFPEDRTTEHTPYGHAIHNWGALKEKLREAKKRLERQNGPK